MAHNPRCLSVAAAVAAVASSACAGSLPPAPFVPTTRLANGVDMPRVVLGMGPWCNGHDCYNDSVAAADVELAFSVGFNGIDTALGYGNQRGVGVGIKGFTRESVWVGTKIPSCHAGQTIAECQAETNTNFDTDLADLNVSYVDIMLLHSPPSNGSGTACRGDVLCSLARAQWEVMIQRYNNKQARAIGVSNYCSVCFDCLEGLKPVPHVNQIQYHAGMPGADPTGIVSDAKARGIVIQAYSPLGNYATHSLLKANITNEIGRAHNKSAAQVGLRWVLQNNISDLTLAVAANNKSYLIEDIDVFNWSLTDDDMHRLNTEPFAPEDPTRGTCKA